MGTVKDVYADWLIDGSGEKALTDQLISIKNGRFQSIRKSDPDHMPDEELTDGSECTILPGLIDSHVHLFMSGTHDRMVRDDQ